MIFNWKACMVSGNRFWEEVSTPASELSVSYSVCILGCLTVSVLIMVTMVPTMVSIVIISFRGNISIFSMVSGKRFWEGVSTPAYECLLQSLYFSVPHGKRTYYGNHGAYHGKPPVTSFRGKYIHFQLKVSALTLGLGPPMFPVGHFTFNTIYVC